MSSTADVAVPFEGMWAIVEERCIGIVKVGRAYGKGWPRGRSRERRAVQRGETVVKDLEKFSIVTENFNESVLEG